MKLNIVNVINAINAEEVSMELFNNPAAPWNCKAVDDYIGFWKYDRDIAIWSNEQAIDLYEWNMKHGYTNDHISFDKVYDNFFEWFENEMKKTASYYIETPDYSGVNVVEREKSVDPMVIIYGY